MKKSFHCAKLIWWITIPFFLFLLFFLVHYPYIIPFHSLSFLGAWSYHLVSNYRLLLFILFWFLIIVHIYESILAYRHCRQINLDSESTRLWIIQTFFLGYISLKLLYQSRSQRLW